MISLFKGKLMSEQLQALSRKKSEIEELLKLLRKVTYQIEFWTHKQTTKSVAEDSPLPVALWPPQGLKTHDDYFELAYNAAGRSEYSIGTGANQALPNVPLFTSLNTTLLASTNVWVWFNVSQSVRHRLIANRYYNYSIIPVRKIFAQGVAAGGTLFIDVEGVEE
jgi:hypothetical protein